MGIGLDWADLAHPLMRADGCWFPLTLSTAPPRSSPEAVMVQRDLPVRLFVALFDYDPMSMSPNPDAGEEELPFREGQILKVTPSPLALHWLWR